jgi:hypothetical protein
MTMLAGLALGSGGRSALADQIATSGEEPVGPKSVTLFTMRGAGSRNGTDWQNAMALESLPKALDDAGPGSGFFIGFDPAAGEPVALDRDQLQLAVSGTKNDPIFLEAGLIDGANDIAAAAGADGQPWFRNTRGWSLENFGKPGAAPCYIALNKGASHLRLAGFRVDGTPADGFVKFRGKKDNPTTFDDVAISGIDATNVGRIIETDRGANLQNVLIEDCRAFGIVRGFARFWILRDSTLRKLELDADNMDAGGKNVCQLIALASGENVVFEDIVVRNAINDPAKSGKKKGYVQGDGIVCERKTRAVTIRRCHGSGMGDAAFDVKTTNVVIEDSSSDGCKFGARVWSESDNVIRRCDFRNPKSIGGITGACIEACGRLEIVDTKLHAGPGTLAIKLHKLKNGNDPIVHMRGGSIQLDGDAKVAGGIGPAVLELHQVAVNGVMTDHRYVFEGKKE